MSLIFKKSTAQPQFTDTPTISGTLEVGEALSVTDGGIYRHLPGTVGYEWESYDQNGENPILIASAGSTYQLTGNELGRRIVARVHGTNPAGTNWRNSEMTAPVTAPTAGTSPAFTSLPAISGTAEVGQTLTESGFAGTDYTAVTYTWYRYSSVGDGKGGGVAVLVGTNASTYVVAQDDAAAGGYIGVTVLLSDGDGEYASQKSAVTSQVQYSASENPQFLDPVTVALDQHAANLSAGEYVVCKTTILGATATPEFTWTVADNADGLTGGTVRTVVDSAPFKPLPYTQPNTYWSYLWISDESTPSDVGRYVTCAVKAVNGFTGPTGVVSQGNVLGPIGAIVGTPLAQTDFNSGYLAITSPGTYYLTENVTADLSGVAVLAENVTFNGNGKTLTWNNLPAVYMTNPGFEDGATGWDFTNSGNGGTLGVGQIGDSAYCEVSAASRTPAYSILTDENYAFNLRLAREGVRALRWTTTAVNNNGGDRQEFWVESSEVTVQADTWWELKWCCYAPNGERAPDGFVGVYKDGVLVVEWRYWGGNLTTSGKNQTWFHQKGPHESSLLFKSDATTPTYTVRVGIHSASWATDGVWFDDFQLCPARCCGFLVGQGSLGGYSGSTGVYGGTVYGSTSGTNSNGDRLDVLQAGQPAVADIAATGTAGSNTVIKNLTMTQGPGKSYFGYAIRGDAVKVSHVSSTVIGGCSGNLRPYNTDTQGRYHVSDCAFYANVPRCNPWRDLFWGANLVGVEPGDYQTSFIERTVISGQVGVGVLCKGQTTGAKVGGEVVIRGCTLQSKSSFTNQFSVLCRAAPGLLTFHDNVIDNTGSYYGRCVQAELGHSAEIHHNHISMEQPTWNAEYQGYIKGEWAIQMESTGSTGQVNVFSNVLNLNSNAPTLNVKPMLAAIRPSSLYAGGRHNIYDNEINLTASGDGLAIALYGEVVQVSGHRFYNNVINTNSGVVGGVKFTSADIFNNTINYTTPESTSRLYPVPTEYTGEAVRFDAELVDTTLNARAAELLPATAPKRYDSGGLEPNSRYAMAWTVTFDTGVEGDTIQVKDKDGLYVAVGYDVRCTGVAATNVITSLEPHLFDANDKITFRDKVGATGLSNGVVYYVINPTSTTFQVSLTSGGAAVALGTNLSVAFCGLAEVATDALGVVNVRLQSSRNDSGTITNYNDSPGYTASKNGGVFASIGSITAPVTVNL